MADSSPGNHPIRCRNGKVLRRGMLLGSRRQVFVAWLEGVFLPGSSAQGTSPPPRRKIWHLGSLFPLSFGVASASAASQAVLQALQLRTYVDLREGRDFEGADAEVHHVLFPPSPSTTARGALTGDRCKVKQLDHVGSCLVYPSSRIGTAAKPLWPGSQLLPRGWSLVTDCKLLDWPGRQGRCVGETG